MRATSVKPRGPMSAEHKRAISEGRKARKQAGGV
jgi:hypothetical protein